MDLIGKYEDKQFPANRRFIIDALTAGTNRSSIYGLLELDVTQGRDSLRKNRRGSGEYLSFTGWIMKCIAQAVSENKEVQAYRQGNKRLITFEDVDISLVAERFVDGKSHHFPCVVRKAQEKSVEEISLEILAAKQEKLSDGTVVLGEKRAFLEKVARWAPTFARRMFWRKMKRDAFLTKKTMGTVSITSLSMFGKTSGYVIPAGIHNLGFGLGSITPKPAIVKGVVQTRQYLHMTIIANHEVIDGAPLARFVTRLSELVEGGFGL
jgi:pyruvate/2-oxoglutarate dehydrogenase complex dihydrolipoamide acyltransferase (E2) component